MAYNEILISGFGGQGVMAIGKTLAEAGMFEGLNVSWLPSYGPEMRGGTANCGVVIADTEIISPIVLEPSELIAMNLPSLDKFGPMVKKGGTIFVNTSIVTRKVERDDVKAIYVPSMEIATEIGNSRVANMAMLGAFIEATKLLKYDTIVAMLKQLFTGPKAHLVALNEQALQHGAACVNG
ncbi:MAG: 2-oxoacid:ferredoxin oxidoreductase subunit gamma [Clostridiaceae bacterium]|jgi:2-oxoglutarate ferredoxin oxidoreductase subunit gamma|nr:2-oxoacid:ferredoxin oxidoreductase subunit gamma [Clostridiaceae bacterium]